MKWEAISKKSKTTQIAGTEQDSGDLVSAKDQNENKRIWLF